LLSGFIEPITEDPKMSKQAAAGKRKHIILRIPQKV